MPYTDEKGWRVLESAIRETAREFDLSLVTVQTTFRKVINEGELTNAFMPQLHDNWWHAIQHSIAIISHAAPCDWVRKVGRQYIAASLCAENVGVTIASDPSVDNNIRFAGCRVYHDGYVSRIEKSRSVVKYHNETGKKTILHVCWQTTTGNNCCTCEKCYRTIAGILIEQGDPEVYGFPSQRISYRQMKKDMTETIDLGPSNNLPVYWKQFQERMRETKGTLSRTQHYKDIKWIETYDFLHPDRYWKRRLNHHVQTAFVFYRRGLRKVKHVAKKLLGRA